MEQQKIFTAEQAIDLIDNEDIIAVDGFKCSAIPEEIFVRLRERYDATGTPRNLTFFSAPSMGTEGRGADRLAAEGLLKTFICSHTAITPAVGKLAMENKLCCYMFPLGSCVGMMRAAAAGEPGFLTHIGLGTYVDPRMEGGKVNGKAREAEEEMVSLVRIGETDYLYFKAIHPDICFIKATFADEVGNTSFEREAMYLAQFELAAATHNSGGKVVVVVDRIVQKGSLDPRNVKIHSFMVDYIVETAPEYAGQGYTTGNLYHGEYSGELRLPVHSAKPLPLDPRKVCGRRGAFELPARAGALINLGAGVPECISSVAEEEGMIQKLTLSIEAGTIGGIPQSGNALGMTINPEAIYRMSDMLQVYDGGGIDVAFLGAAEIDASGNVNVSKFNGKLIGPGGFINIAQNAKKVCFMGTFTAGGLREHIENGQLIIHQEGRIFKFKKQVEQVTFSGRYALEHGQSVLYITERAVFQLTGAGIELIELAPGVDIERDVIEQMEFRPIVSPQLRPMDARIFQEGIMQLNRARC